MPDLGARIGWHLPFIPDVKVFAEGTVRGFLPQVRIDDPIPGAFEPDLLHLLVTIPEGIIAWRSGKEMPWVVESGESHLDE